MTAESTNPRESIKLGGYRLPLPRSRAVRIPMGVALVALGTFGFLPVLGFWMIPVGLLVLSVDIPRVRRGRRRFAVWFSRKYPDAASKLGVRSNGSGAAGKAADGEVPE